MTKALIPLLIAQFLSAFADNAILFTVIALVMHSGQASGWYIPALQSLFLVAFVVLAPWVGGLADRHPKAYVLMVANGIKAAGTGLLWMGLEPLLAYAVVGIGAALYSPAKYGILPELVGHDRLVKANSWIEGSTILAILTGMVVGAEIADRSTDWALLGGLVLLCISAFTSAYLPKTPRLAPPQSPTLQLFYREIVTFLSDPLARFALLGACLFWAAAAAVRVILIAWAPLVLASQSASDIAQLSLVLAVGIIMGSALAPLLIPLQALTRVRWAAYAMGSLIVLLSLTDSVWPARGVLLLMGIAGGLFVVPVNAALQAAGQHSIGSGSAVAMQNFFQNLAMLLSVGSYTAASAQQISPSSTLVALGLLLITAKLLVVRRMPMVPVAANRE